MSRYIDGFVIPVPKDNIEQYRAIAEQAGAIWKEHGALEYYECVSEDPNAPNMVSFPQLAGAGEGETVVFAWIAFQSRAHRDEVNAKVMADPRMACMGNSGEEMPFDCKRMTYGGFETIVEH